MSHYGGGYHQWEVTKQEMTGFLIVPILKPLPVTLFHHTDSDISERVRELNRVWTNGISYQSVVAACDDPGLRPPQENGLLHLRLHGSYAGVLLTGPYHQDPNLHTDIWPVEP